MKILFLIPVLLGAILLSPAGLKGQNEKRVDSNSEQYPVAGVIVDIRPASLSITIRPYSLRGSLRLKTQEFQVASGSVMGRLQRGDRIVAVYSRRDGRLHRLRTISNQTARR